MHESTLVLERPPFCVLQNMQADAVAQEIVASFEHLDSLPRPLEAVLAGVMTVLQVAPDDPLARCAQEVVAEMALGIGAGVGNAYHNVTHFCEVMLSTFFIAQLAQLSRREQAQVVVAALLHDFHHDGRGNGSHPFRLELLACARAEVYWRRAGVDLNEQSRLRTLILSTEITEGMPMARACYLQHVPAMQEIPPQMAGMNKLLPRPEMSALAIDGRLALQAVVLVEGDLLPSFGLTVEHADRTQTRLAEEIMMPLGPKHKIDFIDHLLGDFTVAKFFSPNLQRIRQVNTERLGCSG